MLKMISKLQFASIYHLLVPCISVLLTVIAVLIVDFIVAVIIVPYDE